MSVPLSRRFLFRLELWLRARLLPFRLARDLPLEDALRLATPRHPPAYPGLPVAYVAKRVARTVRRPWLMRDRRCLREGLLGFRFLREAGHDPLLHFGVDPASLGAPRLAAHCWVSVDGEIVLGPPRTQLIGLHVYPGKDEAA